MINTNNKIDKMIDEARSYYDLAFYCCKLLFKSIKEGKLDGADDEVISFRDQILKSFVRCKGYLAYMQCIKKNLELYKKLCKKLYKKIRKIINKKVKKGKGFRFKHFTRATNLYNESLEAGSLAYYDLDSKKVNYDLYVDNQVYIMNRTPEDDFILNDQISPYDAMSILDTKRPMFTNEEKSLALLTGKWITGTITTVPRYRFFILEQQVAILKAVAIPKIRYVYVKRKKNYFFKKKYYFKNKKKHYFKKKFYYKSKYYLKKEIKYGETLNYFARLFNAKQVLLRHNAAPYKHKDITKRKIKSIAHYINHRFLYDFILKKMAEKAEEKIVKREIETGVRRIFYSSHKEPDKKRIYTSDELMQDERGFLRPKEYLDIKNKK